MADPSTRTHSLNIYTLLAANIISMTGNQLALLAIPWFVLATTGSAAKTGLAAFFSILPAVLAAFFGGTIVDRLGFKRTSVLADVASGVTVALIPLLYGLNLLSFPLLLALVFLGALLDAPGTTAREALIPDLAEVAGMPIERASALVQVVERASRLLGAPLAGVLIAVLGPQPVLWFDAATFAVSAVMVAAIPLRKAVPKREASDYLAELREGLAFIRRERLLRALMLVLVVTNFLDAAKSSVIYPVFAREVYGSAVALGLMFGLSGGGAVVGALVYSAVGPRLRRRWLFVCAFIAVSLPALVLAFLPPLPVVLVTQGLAGVAAGPLNPILSAILYERVPAGLRGRVLGMVTAGAFVAMPLGVLIAGFALERVGLRTALVATGGCYLLTTLSLIFNPTLAEMDAPKRTEAMGLT